MRALALRPAVFQLEQVPDPLFQLSADGQVIKSTPAGKNLAFLTDALQEIFGIFSRKIGQVNEGAGSRFVIMGEKIGYL